MSVKEYKPPFIYFGGKSAVADVVWRGIGADVDNYCEPFFGSGAVLFLRPDAGGKRTETVNDADGFVANFWRAMKHDVDAVAEHADNPVNEADLHARHLWLLGQRERITERLMGDPDFFDAKVAGWWCWGLNCWIGGGWCAGKGPWVSENGVMMLGNSGQGVNRQLPHLGTSGQGVNRQRPHLGNSGQGVNRQQDEPTDRRVWLREWLGTFAERLARVRVCCGDWSRVTGPSVTKNHGTTGVFLDPPYSFEAGRDMRCYAVDCGTVAHKVREWAIQNGSNPLMRIVLAGYEQEHPMPPDWHMHAWKGRGGMGNQAAEDSDAPGRENATKERLWFSPHCLPLVEEAGLFT